MPTTFGGEPKKKHMPLHS
ncbi:hypothetical protein [Staphylococcus aureus]